MGTLDHDGDGVIDMYIDETTGELRKLREVGYNFHTDWTAIRAEIDRLAGELGGGPMGRTFKETYDPWATSLTELVAQARTGYFELADAGNNFVMKYIFAQARIANRFKS